MGTPMEKTKKGCLSKWQTWVTFLVALLTAVTLLFQIQEKVVKLFRFDGKDSSISQKLTGEIVDEQSIPIIGVIVELPEYNLHNETNEHGKFEFTVKASREAQVVFRARKQGFKTINHDPYLGGSFLSYTMRRKHD